jgi:5-methyltetrahydropteroyltriglutamate--homocysteine methyltransferase
MGLLTTTVGWLPRPPELRAARRAFQDGDIDEGPLHDAEQAATRQALALQESLQLDLLTDGQMDRADQVSWFLDRLDGVEPGGTVRCFGHHYTSRPRIVADLSRPETVAVEAWKAALALTRRPLQAVLTGPYTLMDGSFDEHYRSRERCCMALAEVVRAEAEDLVAAGARDVLIAEPALAARPEELDFAVAALARVTEPLAGRARTWTHLAYQDFTSSIARLLWLPVDGLILEMANSNYQTLEALAELPAGKLLAAGVLDVLDPRVETAAELRGRIERLLRQVPPERLWLAPDAGMRVLDWDAGVAKLKAMSEAAAAF